MLGIAMMIALAIVAFLFASLAVVLLVPSLRRTIVSGPVMRVVEGVLPHMSETERTALEAGTVWWDGELFSGDPDWTRLLAFAPQKLSDAEHAFIAGPVEELCAMVDEWKVEESRDLPPEVWSFIKRERFFGMIIPRSYGGLGFSAAAHSDVVTKIASRSVTTAVTVMVPNSLGPAELLLAYGTDEQKHHFLPRLASGEEIPCFALTGPEAGSDAASTESEGIVMKGWFEGREVLGIRLNWEKRYITLAPVAAGGTISASPWRSFPPTFRASRSANATIRSGSLFKMVPSPVTTFSSLSTSSLADLLAPVRVGGCSWSVWLLDGASRCPRCRWAPQSWPRGSWVPTRSFANNSTRRLESSKASRNPWPASAVEFT
jgi:hypothetical protein